MTPFKVFDKKNKTTWVVLNYHPARAQENGGTYLVAREDDSNKDGELCLINAEELCKFKWVDFFEHRET
jgi:hypothetical protein